MFIIVQIPFVDLRLLSENTREKYSDCIFPNNFERKMNQRTYYRYLGDEKLRYSPIELPESERQFFDSSRLLVLNKNVQISNDPYQPRLLFSRLFTDVQMFHFDVGIREVTKSHFHRRDINKFINQFMTLPLFGIRKRRLTDRAWYNFPELTEQIKKLYIYATDKKKRVTGDPEHERVHSYKESVRIILRHLRESNDFSKEKIIYFFEYLMVYLNREKFYGYSNEDFWKLVFAIDDRYNHVTWNDYKNKINAYFNAVRDTADINSGIIIHGDVGHNATLVTHSTGVNVSVSQ